MSSEYYSFLPVTSHGEEKIDKMANISYSLPFIDFGIWREMMFSADTGSDEARSPEEWLR